MSLNNDDVIRAIEAVERELATIGGLVSEMVCLTYPMGMPCPSHRWAQEALKPLGVEFVKCIVFPHRLGHEYKGLFVTTRPNREFPGDWLKAKCPIINGTELRWIHPALNAEYAKLSS